MYKLFVLFALVAVAFSAPSPLPEPKADPGYIATAPIAYSGYPSYGYGAGYAYGSYAYPSLYRSYPSLGYQYQYPSLGYRSGYYF